VLYTFSFIDPQEVIVYWAAVGLRRHPHTTGE